MIKEWWNNGSMRVTIIIIGAFIIIALVFLMAWFFPVGKINYMSSFDDTMLASLGIPVEKVAHIPTPAKVKAVYLSSWAAGNGKFRRHLFDLLDNTEINSVVIDVKDYTGRISFPVDDPELAMFGASENRIPDIKEFIQELHGKGVYVIGRVSSFQDSYLIKGHPEWAVKDNEGGVWKDFKGVKWLDAGATPVWDYLVSIGNESYAKGFDEINFDYIRYPSDGNMKDISYTWSDGRTRDAVMRSFYKYIHEKFQGSGIPISADFFGLTTSAKGDLGIGQVLEDALANFDYVSPMVYPSHFGHGFEGFQKPAEHPYEVVRSSMDSAVARAITASTSPLKLRPWLQAFDLGAIYTPAMVQAQIRATYDAGLDSWLLWDAASIYDKNDFLSKDEADYIVSKKVGTTTSI